MSIDFGDTQRAYSDLHGGTLSQIAAVISQMDEAAKTEWVPRYTLASDGSSNATVTVATKITMPRWLEYGSAGEAERAEWDRFFAALDAHEQGHLDLVKQQLSSIDVQLAGQSPDQAVVVWSTALQQLQLASDNYDVETAHGQNQGTIINLPSAPISSEDD